MCHAVGGRCSYLGIKSVFESVCAARQDPGSPAREQKVEEAPARVGWSSHDLKVKFNIEI